MHEVFTAEVSCIGSEKDGELRCQTDVSTTVKNVGRQRCDTPTLFRLFISCTQFLSHNGGGVQTVLQPHASKYRSCNRVQAYIPTPTAVRKTQGDVMGVPGQLTTSAT